MFKIIPLLYATFMLFVFFNDVIMMVIGRQSVAVGFEKGNFVGPSILSIDLRTELLKPVDKSDEDVLGMIMVRVAIREIGILSLNCRSIHRSYLLI
jgi:hypothetical protein